MPPKFKRHLNDDDVTGSVKSERVSAESKALKKKDSNCFNSLWKSFVLEKSKVYGYVLIPFVFFIVYIKNYMLLRLVAQLYSTSLLI